MPAPSIAVGFRTSLVLAALLLGGCSVKTSVQLTATTPAHVIHAWVTVEELWFTTSLDAVPADISWEKTVLAEPVLLDLASMNGGTAQAIGSVNLQGGSYARMRLVMAGEGSLEYLDEAGASRIVPLEFAHPGSVLQIPVSFSLQGPSLMAAAESPTDAESTATVVVDIDALQGLDIFDNGETAAVLDPGLRARNDSSVGSLSGTFDLSALADGQGIIVSAEALDSDGARHHVVKSARLDSSGRFTLYPLDAGMEYALVVHGAGVRTMVVTGVPVEAGESTALQDSLIPLSTSPSYLVNTGTPVPGGTAAEFYQTLPGSRPYLIASADVDPFAGGFNEELSLATARPLLGTYNGGSTISFTVTSPEEGPGGYRAAAYSRWRAISGFVTVDAPDDDSTATQMITLLQPGFPAGATAGTASGTILLGRAGRFDSLQLIVSRYGQIVDSVDLGATIAGRSAVQFQVTDLPAGTADALYDVSIRAWNSRDPAGTLVRAAFAAQADLRLGDAGGLSLLL